MCSRATCRHCGKASYSGCGAHVEQVLAGVPAAQRCACREEKATARQAVAASGAGSRTWRWPGSRRSTQ